MSASRLGMLGIIALCVCLATNSVRATLLVPGSAVALDTVTGVPVTDSLVATTSADFSAVGYIGTIDENVYTTSGGTLDFVYEFTLTGASLPYSGSLVLYPFEGYSVNASYIAGAGSAFTTGTLTGNDYVSVDHDPIPAGGSSDLLLLQTNATSYSLDGYAVGLSDFNGLFAPPLPASSASSPEPGTFCMGAMAATGLGWAGMRRARRITPRAAA